MKKTLFILLLFLLYQVLGAVMASVWTNLYGGVSHEMNVMPSPTTLGFSMLLSMIMVLFLLLALKLIRQKPWSTNLNDLPLEETEKRTLSIENMLKQRPIWFARVIRGRDLNCKGWGLAIFGFVLLSLGVNFMLAPFELDDLGMMEMFDNMKGSAPCLFLMCVAAPVFEELVFREGILRQLVHTRQPQTSGVSARPQRLNAFNNGTSILWGIIISSLCFAIIHGNLQQALPAFVLGVALGLCYCRTGNVVLCSVLHIINNSMAVALLCFPQVNTRLDSLPTTLSLSLGILGFLIGGILLLGLSLTPLFSKRKIKA